MHNYSSLDTMGSFLLDVDGKELAKVATSCGRLTTVSKLVACTQTWYNSTIQTRLCYNYVHGPGSMLLVEENTFGVRLSHTHPVDGGRSWSPEKLSEQVEQVWVLSCGDWLWLSLMGALQFLCNDFNSQSFYTVLWLFSLQEFQQPVVLAGNCSYARGVSRIWRRGCYTGCTHSAREFFFFFFFFF